MRKIILSIIILVFSLYLSYGYTAIATEQYNGYYENGIFHNGKGEFIVKFTIDEEASVITRTAVIKIKNNKVELDNTRYYITTIDPNAFWGVSKDKAGQKIITAVGKPGMLATEMIQLGDNFYYYCKAIGGVYYISYGTLVKNL